MNFQIWKTILSNQFPIRISELYNNITTHQSSFTPYQNNGGTVISISVDGFSIVASDTRITTGFSIPSRETTRIVKISENILLSSSGMRADMIILQEEFKRAIELWEIENKKNTSISSGAHFLSSILYSRRFFPYYTFNIISGKEGLGKIRSFSFDAVGSFESCIATSSGSGQFLIQPILDGHVKQCFSNNISMKYKILKILTLIKHLFLRASKRNIEIGDGMQIFIFTKKGILVENSILKFD